MQVRHYKIRIGQLPVYRHNGKAIPDNPPMVNSNKKAMAKSIEVVNCILPPYIVASQLNIFTPVGMPINMLLAEKKASTVFPIPTANMW